METKIQLQNPASATNNLINILGVLVFCASLWICIKNGFDSVNSALISAGSYAVFVLFFEVIFLKTYSRPTTGLNFSKGKTDIGRVNVKLIGAYGSYAFVALLYWLFPEYHGSFYNNFWQAVRTLFPYILVLTLPYVLIIDRYMVNPLDGYYYFGKLLLFSYKKEHKPILVQHFLGWVVKGFFLPLMFVFFTNNIEGMQSWRVATLTQSFKTFYDYTTSLMFTFDLLAAVTGYSIAMRIFDNQIRSSEPTLKGWFFCLICYQPFSGSILTLYLAYSANNSLNLLKEHQTLQVIWGCIMLIFLACYTMSSINFGCRFSNITHRGIITNGMYGLMRHPAYFFKNGLWWMTHVPFVVTSGHWTSAIRYSILMIGISLIYYIRAKTEEAHLSKDLTYVQYALYMNEHSIISPLGKLFKFLQYKAPEGYTATTATTSGT